MYTNILIATDGSDLADKAVAQGLAFAEALGSSVIVVTITESLSASEIAAQAEAGNVNVLDNYNTRAKEGAQKILSAAASTAHEMGVN